MPFIKNNIPSAFGILSKSFIDFRERLMRLLKHSGIRDRGLNRPGDVLVVIGAQYEWTKLDGEALVLQRDLLKEWGILQELVSFLSKDIPNSIGYDIKEACQTINYLVRQENNIWSDNKHELEESAAKAVADILSCFNKFADNNSGKLILIPDTNALLTQPDFTKYIFPDTKVELILVPAVVSELDQKKMDRNESIRQKAEKIIRQLKEFRRRGNILDGVIVVKDKINIRFVPIEPKMRESLSWLDPVNMDDRILASTLEIIHVNLGTPVAIITRDMNLENKAELSRVPYIEPPE